MRLEDWREWPAEDVATLFLHEEERWRVELQWEAAGLFALVAQARQDGILPGLVALDDGGRVIGWCYASVQDGFLFIGALHGDRADVVRTLLDAVLESPEAAYAKGYRCFVFPDTPAVAAALTRKRFEVQQFLYLHRPLADADSESLHGVHVREWSTDDLPNTARLLARAYAGTTDGQCFAPGGRLEEWAGYLAQTVRTEACGTWSPTESLHVSTEGMSDPVAVLLSTRLSPATTHVAQVAVDPSWRGRGVAPCLIDQAGERARRAGATAQTLLVSEENAVARRLYTRLGFSCMSHFLYGERARISRVTQPAVISPTAALESVG